MKSHLPPYTIPTQYCWKCSRFIRQPNRMHWHQTTFQCAGDMELTEDRIHIWVQLMRGVLMKICWYLSIPGITSLYHLMRSEPELQPDPDTPMSPQEVRLFHAFEEDNYFTEATELDLCGIGLLTHWRVIFNLLRRLSPEEQEVVQQMDEPTDPMGSPSLITTGDPRQTTVRVVDTHFHLDKLLPRLRAGDWQEVLRMMPETCPKVDLDFLVTCFAFPESWPRGNSRILADISAAQHPSLRFSLGWHPTRAGETTPASLAKFEEILDNILCVAVGEVGLDYHRGRTDRVRERQRTLLRTLLPFVLRTRKPLVIHCRNAEVPDESSATRECISILERGLPKIWAIYVHCFNGSREEYTLWLRAFPRARFGISPVILSSRHHPELPSVVRQMDPYRILLETDSPYLSVAGMGIPCPIQVVEVGKEVAKLRDIPASVLFHLSRQASHMFYQPGLWE